MNVPKNTIDQFSKMMVGNTKEKNSNTTNIMGTLVVVGNKKYVQIDGSEIRTPCYEASGANNGDRVLVSMKNHQVIVTGNFTNPPEANAAVNVGNGTLTITQGDVIKGSFQANQSGPTTIPIDPIPKNVSEFQNDANYLKPSNLTNLIARIEKLEQAVFQPDTGQEG